MMVHDIVEENGKTIKENNMTKTHKYNVGDLVFVRSSTWHGRGRASVRFEANLWICALTRDCDGTPLYNLSPTHPDDMKTVPRMIFENEGVGWEAKPDIAKSMYYKVEGGYPEEMLTLVDDPDTEKELSWED